MGVEITQCTFNHMALTVRSGLGGFQTARFERVPIKSDYLVGFPRRYTYIRAHLLKQI